MMEILYICGKFENNGRIEIYDRDAYLRREEGETRHYV